MRRVLLACLALSIGAGGVQAAEWRVQRLDAPARVMGIETAGGKVLVDAGGLRYRLDVVKGRPALTFIDTPVASEPPAGALPDGRVATGTRDIARAWFAAPTRRYDHGILGDKVEASALVIETRDGKRQTVDLKDDAVFEDLEPRLADLDGDGLDEIVVIKSYLKRGASLAVIAERKGRYEIVAETPSIGGTHRWLNPAGIADYNGDGKIDIALVRQPHAIGELELWTGYPAPLRKLATMPDTANHVVGTRALHMSATADFDGDGIADLALPSFDRKHLRIISFAPEAREIADVALPERAATNIGLVARASNPPAIAVGLADGTLALIQRE